jgi:hypothetical protein
MRSRFSVNFFAEVEAKPLQTYLIKSNYSLVGASDQKDGTRIFTVERPYELQRSRSTPNYGSCGQFKKSKSTPWDVKKSHTCESLKMG